MGAFGVVNTCFQSLGPLLMGIFVGHGTLGSLKIVSELGILAFSFFLFFSLFFFFFFFFGWLVGLENWILGLLLSRSSFLYYISLRQASQPAFFPPSPIFHNLS